MQFRQFQKFFLSYIHTAHKNFLYFIAAHTIWDVFIIRKTLKTQCFRRIPIQLLIENGRIKKYHTYRYNNSKHHPDYFYSFLVFFAEHIYLVLCIMYCIEY